jgi:hypothetical protein
VFLIFDDAIAGCLPAGHLRLVFAQTPVVTLVNHLLIAGERRKAKMQEHCEGEWTSHGQPHVAEVSLIGQMSKVRD